MKKIFARYLRPYAGRMTVGLIIKFTGSMMDLLLPYILSYLIDEVVPAGSMIQIVRWGMMMILLSWRKMRIIWI